MYIKANTVAAASHIQHKNLQHAKMLYLGYSIFKKYNTFIRVRDKEIQRLRQGERDVL